MINRNDGAGLMFCLHKLLLLPHSSRVREVFLHPFSCWELMSHRTDLRFIFHQLTHYVVLLPQLSLLSIFVLFLIPITKCLQIKDKVCTFWEVY